MEVNSTLSKIKTDCNALITKNKVNIRIISSRYQKVKQCFDTDEENQELYQFIYDIAIAYKLPETFVYSLFVESKYNEQGELLPNFEDNFAEQITLQYILKQ